MGILIIGLVIFLGVHSVSIVKASWRDHMVAKIGEWPWKGIYSILALIGFVLIVWGYAMARQEPSLVYATPRWLRHLAMLLLIPVFPLLLATYLPGRIQAVSKHPMLIATAIWAFAHLLVNGTLADVLLFGGFLVWAVLDLVSLRYRSPSPPPRAPVARVNDAIAVIGGLGIYVVFVFWLHSRLIGVPIVGMGP